MFAKIPPLVDGIIDINFNVNTDINVSDNLNQIDGTSQQAEVSWAALLFYYTQHDWRHTGLFGDT